MADLSADETTSIVRKFLLDAPPGEWKEVLNDLRALVDNNDLLDGALEEIARTYNKEQLVHLHSKTATHKFPLCEAGEIDESHHYDPHADEVVEIDHHKTESVSTRAAEEHEKSSKGDRHRENAQKSVGKYMDQHFKEGAHGVYCKDNDEGFVVTVAISGRKFNPRNFWGGSWRSIFEFVVKDGNDSAKCTGKYTLLVHYYEDGNVQLRNENKFNGSIQFSSPEDFGTQVAAFIEKMENGQQNNLAAQYTALQETTFKALRRKMPLIQQRFQWNTVSKYSLAKELTRDK